MNVATKSKDWYVPTQDNECAYGPIHGCVWTKRCSCTHRTSRSAHLTTRNLFSVLYLLPMWTWSWIQDYHLIWSRLLDAYSVSLLAFLLYHNAALWLWTYPWSAIFLTWELTACSSLCLDCYNVTLGLPICVVLLPFDSASFSLLFLDFRPLTVELAVTVDFAVLFCCFAVCPLLCPGLLPLDSHLLLHPIPVLWSCCLSLAVLYCYPTPPGHNSGPITLSLYAEIPSLNPSNIRAL